MKSEIKAKEVSLKGIVASPGIAIGRSFRHSVAGQAIAKREIPKSQVEAEIERLREAVGKAVSDLEQIRGEADRTVGPQLSKIFEAQLLILEDQEFFRKVADDIARQHLSADFVYNRHLQQTLKSLRNSHDSYLREMANDINATAAKVFGHLIGTRSNKLVDNKSKVALAEDFSPGEVVLMNKYHIPGFATQLGGPTSHMSLIAKSLSIPGVVGVSQLLKKCADDTPIIIDGDNGLVILNPSAKTLTHYQHEHKRHRGVTSRQLKSIARLPSTTTDGREIAVMANLEIPSDLDQTLSACKIGVGLYRTEFFYLSTMKFPSEEEQTRQYHEIARTFFPNTVVMRTFDLGSDKLVGDLHNSDESNPALGWRGIRFDLDVPEIFKAQMRALLKASEFRNIKIMLPMVTSLSEIMRTKKLVHASMTELRKEGIAFDEDIEIGIMIEVPSAALMAHELAKHVDFLSIGTNDLIQYTLAVDRGNKKVAALYREFHPAVLQLIKMTIDAGIANGIEVAMCGEMAGKRLALPLLVGMGLTSFSVGPMRLPEVRRIIANLNYNECRRLADRVLTIPSADRVEAAVQEWFAARVGELGTED
jgi:phosphoenolpyruvate-protein phosphotransferase (PTS system enzyme I)